MTKLRAYHLGGLVIKTYLHYIICEAEESCVGG